jgi:CubicO group peptidase (beta-lactamase class C family)
VRIRHLLTHTSGLPDMLPENVALRAAHAPLSAFVERSCSTPLLFSPGSACSYQSMGILLAAAVVETVSGMPLPQFLEHELSRPLGMGDTWLGLGALAHNRMPRVILAPADEQASWNWNSLYWRGLGAPWGGLNTTAQDYARFLHLMLAAGSASQAVLSPGMRRAMLANQLSGLPGLPEQARREHAWGLGWRLNQPAGAHSLPEIASTQAFGHGGATGTCAWADPASGLACVILTNDPQSGRFRSLLSNLVAAAGAWPATKEY